jgi:hypothetical protein
MFCIEIIGVPQEGPAPESVREKWAGLKLPLYYDGEPRAIYYEDLGHKVYPIPVVTALAILSLRQHEAAKWWLENTRAVMQGGNFLFRENCCRVVKGLPSLDVPSSGQASVGQLLQAVEENEEVSYALLYARHQLESEEWEQFKSLPATRAAVVFVADLVQVELSNYLLACSDEERFHRIRTLGKIFFRALYVAAQARGIEIEWRLLNRPLSFVDQMIQEGYLEEVEGGVAPVNTTEIISSSEQSFNAENN